MIEPPSIIMPVYNEEGIIEKVIREVHATIIEKIHNSTLLVIDDGSRDQTPSILDRLSSELKGAKVFH